MTPRGYDPNQPRVPAGHPDGGQWTDDASLATTSARIGAELSELYTVKFPDDVYKAVLWNGRAYQTNPRDGGTKFQHHNQILSQMALENKDQFPRTITEWAEFDREEGVIDDSNLEIQIQQVLKAYTLEMRPDGIMVVVAGSDGWKPGLPRFKFYEPTAMNVIKQVQKAIDAGVITLNKFANLQSRNGHKVMFVHVFDKFFEVNIDELWKVEKVRFIPGDVKGTVIYKDD